MKMYFFLRYLKKQSNSSKKVNTFCSIIYKNNKLGCVFRTREYAERFRLISDKPNNSKVKKYIWAILGPNLQICTEPDSMKLPIPKQFLF